jgi:hypothetical protein
VDPCLILFTALFFLQLGDEHIRLDDPGAASDPMGVGGQTSSS